MKSMILIKMARQDEVDLNSRHLNLINSSIRGQDHLLNWFIGGKQEASTKGKVSSWYIIIIFREFIHFD